MILVKSNKKWNYRKSVYFYFMRIKLNDEHAHRLTECFLAQGNCLQDLSNLVGLLTCLGSRLKNFFHAQLN